MTPVNPELDLVLDRTLPVPPRLVWRAWTEPALITQWFTPAPWRTTAAEIDLRPGGTFRTVMEGPNGERVDNAGCWLEVVPERRLTFTDSLGPDFRPKDGGFITAVMTLEAAGEGTRYVAHVLHKDVADRERHATMGFFEGWGTATDQLVALAQRLG
jgi:uncharacterized protein YndB with AHSA1/START domain